MTEFIQPNSTLQNRYLIKGYIAKGAMGAVYRAFDNRLKCNVAVKQQLLDHNEFTIKLFQREAELLANLKHSGLPKVTDFFLDGDNYFLVMELVEGDDLETILKQGQRLSYEQGLHFFEQLLDILIYLHSTRIIHTDIKPANLKINQDLELKLIDFGIAKGSFGQITSDVAEVGGTRLYMSLEQTEYGQASNLPVTGKSDLYCACATFYHLLTGQPPVPALQRSVERKKNGVDPLKLMSNLNSAIPVAVAEVFSQAMELLPENRTTTAFELKEILQRKKIEKYRKYNKWGSQLKNHEITKLSNIPNVNTVIPLISTNETGDPEIIIGWIDRTPFIYELAKLKPFAFNHKSLLYQTSHGFIVVELVYVVHPDIPNEMYAGFESYINLYNPQILTTYFELARQTHWHLFLIGHENEVVNFYEFENSYDLENTLNRAVKLTRNSPRGDFLRAKQEFTDTFSMEDLFRM